MDPRAFVQRATLACITLLPAWAAACPACAARGGTSEAVGWAIAAMIGAPLLVGGVLATVAHRMETLDADGPDRPTAEGDRGARES